MTVINPFDFFLEEYAERYPFTYAAGLAADLEPYLRRLTSLPGPVPARWWRSGSTSERPGAAARPHRRLPGRRQPGGAARRRYTVRMEPGVQSPDNTLDQRVGSCRDSAWLLVSVLRELGLAARFVSGYLVQLPPTSPRSTGPSGPTKDFTDLHAWTEVFVPGAGWIGLDPTAGCSPARVTSRCPRRRPRVGGPDHRLHRAGAGTFGFHNPVTRVHEDARVTAPYTDEQWARVDALGEHVDQLLVDGDVRLTMGGEPTFVSASDKPASSGRWLRTVPRSGSCRAARGAARGPLGARRARPPRPGQVVPRGAAAALAHRRSPGAPTAQPLWRDPALLDHPWGEPVVGDDAPAERLARSIAGCSASLTRTCCPPTTIPAPAPGTWPRRARAGDPISPTTPLAVDASRRSRPRPRRAAGWCRSPRSRPTRAWGTTQWRLRRARLFLDPGRLPLRATAPARLAGLVPAAGGARRVAVRRLPDPCRHRDGRGAGDRCHDIEDAPRHALSRRAARRAPLRVPAAADRMLEHALDRSCARRAAAPRAGRPGRARGLPAALRPADHDPVSDARPRGHRGQHPAHRRLGRARDLTEASTTTPATPGWRPRSSTWTAPTPVPAAATTSRSAAPPRPIRRCCAGPTCCAA